MKPGRVNPANKTQAYPLAVSGDESLHGKHETDGNLMATPIAPCMETCRVNAQKSADGIVVFHPLAPASGGQDAETKARTRKGGRAFHKLRDGDESDQDEPHTGALWINSPLK